VTRQREAYREGTLARDRVERLDAAGFHWGDNAGGGGASTGSPGNNSHLAGPSPASASSVTQYDESSPDPVARLTEEDRRRSGGRGAKKRHSLLSHGSSGSGARGGRRRPDDAEGEEEGEPARSLAAALDSWNAQYKALVKYKRENGHANVPPDDRKHAALASWCRDVRALHRRKELDKDRVRKLRKLGFKWANRKTGPKASWEERFSQLAELLRLHGGMENLLHYAAAAESLRSRADEPSALETIVSWVDYQRVLRKHNKLDQDKIDRLTSVGLVWDAHQAAWDARYKQLVALSEHGTKPRDYSSYVKWEHRQRREYRLGTLNNDRVARLDAVGFRWEPRPTRRRASNQSAASRLSAASSADNYGAAAPGGGGAGGGTPDPRRRAYSGEDDFGAGEGGGRYDGRHDHDPEEDEEAGHDYEEDDEEEDDDVEAHGYYYDHEGSHSVSSLDDSRRDSSRRGEKGPLPASSSRKRSSPSSASPEAVDYYGGPSSPAAAAAGEEYEPASAPPASRRGSIKKPRRSPAPDQV
jgi:hypothetical protein